MLLKKNKPSTSFWLLPCFHVVIFSTILNLFNFDPFFAGLFFGGFLTKVSVPSSPSSLRPHTEDNPIIEWRTSHANKKKIYIPALHQPDPLASQHSIHKNLLEPGIMLSPGLHQFSFAVFLLFLWTFRKPPTSFLLHMNRFCWSPYRSHCSFIHLFNSTMRLLSCQAHTLVATLWPFTLRFVYILTRW